jgi:hypothetical protein
MNSIETLPVSIERNGSIYTLEVYVTAWSKLCVAYRNIVVHPDKYCSVVIEPDNYSSKPNIENNYIGNAQNLDEAIEMIKEYIENN